MFFFRLSLSDLEDQWTKWITEHSTHDQTLTNCILAAAYMTYCSPFDADLRRILCQKFFKFCEQYEIPREADLVFQVCLIKLIKEFQSFSFLLKSQYQLMVFQKIFSIFRLQ